MEYLTIFTLSALVPIILLLLLRESKHTEIVGFLEYVVSFMVFFYLVVILIMPPLVLLTHLII